MLNPLRTPVVSSCSWAIGFSRLLSRNVKPKPCIFYFHISGNKPLISSHLLTLRVFHFRRGPPTTKVALPGPQKKAPQVPLAQASWASMAAGSSLRLPQAQPKAFSGRAHTRRAAFAPSNSSSQTLGARCFTLTGLPVCPTTWARPVTWEEKHWQVSKIYKELFIWAARIPGSWWNWKPSSSQSPDLPHFLNTCIFHSIFLAARWSNNSRKVFWGLHF